MKRNRPFDVTPIEDEVLELKDQHRNTWRDEPDLFWLARLVEEVGELSSALLGRHEHSPELELKQIAAITMNWLEHRARK